MKGPKIIQDKVKVLKRSSNNMISSNMEVIAHIQDLLVNMISTIFFKIIDLFN